MSVIEIAIGVGIILLALVIIFLVVIQESKTGGLASSLGGDSMLMEGRSRSNNLAAAKYTKFCAIGLFVFILAMAFVNAFL
ncbi:preprotein translocase subunit SecG [Ruminococcaceae bacterium OttesenSCG-928-N02]|nr:preprotein translocase subunit SecG [Ruminococcaceae bacterium OttesenSCG-928-N02]